MLFVVRSPFSKGLLVETECYWQIQLRWIINNYELHKYSCKYQFYVGCFVYKLSQINL